MAGVRQVLGVFSLVILVQWISSDCVQRVPVPDLEKYRWPDTNCSRRCESCSYSVEYRNGLCTRFKKHVITIELIDKSQFDTEWNECLGYCQQDRYCMAAYLRHHRADDMFDTDYCYLLQDIDSMAFIHSERDKYVALTKPCI